MKPQGVGGSLLLKTVYARPAAGSMTMAAPACGDNCSSSTQMRSGCVGSGVRVHIVVISDALTTLPSMSITSICGGKALCSTPTTCGPARDLCAATKAGLPMRAHHPLQTHRNRHRVFAGSLASTSKTTSSGSDTPPSRFVRFASIVVRVCSSRQIWNNFPRYEHSPRPGHQLSWSRIRTPIRFQIPKIQQINITLRKLITMPRIYIYQQDHMPRILVCLLS